MFLLDFLEYFFLGVGGCGWGGNVEGCLVVFIFCRFVIFVFCIFMVGNDVVVVDCGGFEFNELFGLFLLFVFLLFVFCLLNDFDWGVVDW